MEHKTAQTSKKALVACCLPIRYAKRYPATDDDVRTRDVQGRQDAISQLNERNKKMEKLPVILIIAAALYYAHTLGLFVSLFAK